MVSIERVSSLEEAQVTVTGSSQQRKLDRIRSGKTPRVLDLFAGCGGLSLGFHAAKFEIVGAVELDPVAAKTHALNFYKDQSDLQELHGQLRDITSVEPEQLMAEL